MTAVELQSPAERVPIGQGLFAIVDASDFERVAAFKWRPNKKPDGRVYATASIWLGSRQSTIFMHRLIAHTPAGMETDHINGNGLDNRRANLRVATSSQNNANRGKMQRLGKSTASRYKGVTWLAKRQLWRARIGEQGRNRELGVFATQEEAAHAYDAAAIAKWGTFARLNFPGSGGAACL